MGIHQIGTVQCPHTFLLNKGPMFSLALDHEPSKLLPIKSSAGARMENIPMSKMHSDHPSLIIANLIPAQPIFTSVSEGAIALRLWNTRYVAQDQPLSDLDFHFCATTDLGSLRSRLSSWRNLSWPGRLAGRTCSPHCNHRRST